MVAPCVTGPAKIARIDGDHLVFIVRDSDMNWNVLAVAGGKRLPDKHALVITDRESAKLHAYRLLREYIRTKLNTIEVPAFGTLQWQDCEVPPWAADHLNNLSKAT